MSKNQIKKQLIIFLKENFSSKLPINDDVLLYEDKTPIPLAWYGPETPQVIVRTEGVMLRDAIKQIKENKMVYTFLF